MVERVLWEHEVAGSSPVIPTIHTMHKTYYAFCGALGKVVGFTVHRPGPGGTVLLYHSDTYIGEAANRSLVAESAEEAKANAVAYAKRLKDQAMKDMERALDQFDEQLSYSRKLLNALA